MNKRMNMDASAVQPPTGDQEWNFVPAAMPKRGRPPRQVPQAIQDAVRSTYGKDHGLSITVPDGSARQLVADIRRVAKDNHWTVRVIVDQGDGGTTVTFQARDKVMRKAVKPAKPAEVTRDAPSE